MFLYFLILFYYLEIYEQINLCLYLKHWRLKTLDFFAYMYMYITLQT